MNGPVPATAKSYFQRGIAVADQGNLEEATRYFEQALREAPGFTAAKLMLGTCSFHMGRLDDARARFESVLDTEPANLDALFQLAHMDLVGGRFESALNGFDTIIGLKPDVFIVRLEKGIALQELGRTDLAVDSFKRATEIDPAQPSGFLNIGHALRTAGRFDEAIVAYRSVLERDPRNVRALTYLGASLREVSDFEGARKELSKAISLDPKDPDAAFQMGRTLEEVNDLETAIEFYETAYSLDSRFIGALRASGFLHQSLGNKVESEKRFRDGLSIDPTEADLWHLLSFGKKFREGDPDIESMESLAGSGRLTDEKRVYLLFALAKAFDDIGAFDEAFGYLEEANRLKRAQFEFSLPRHDQLLQTIAEKFGDALDQRLVNPAQDDFRPIFVVGMPRSGTSLVEQILSSHSQVVGLGELKFMRTAIEREFPAWISAPYKIEPLENVRAAYFDYLTRLGAPKGYWVVDKAPSNFVYVDMISRCFPEARVVHCLRNPMDTCFSCFKQLFEGKQKFAYDQEELGRYYRSYRAFMAKWETAGRGDILDVRYEDLASQTNSEIQRILDFLGIPWEDGCEEFFLNTRAVKTASLVQVRQPIYASSINKWKAYEKHLGPLIAEVSGL